jgi:tripartite-type tricarboxylate transporter receptor subunit TctC
VARGAFVRDDAAVACGEAGFKTVLSDNWYGLIGPADLPAEVEARLRNAAISTLRSAELKKQFDTQDAVPSPSTPEEFAAFVKGSGPNGNRWCPQSASSSTEALT